MERKATMLRFPPKLYEHLIREAGERAMKTGKRMSVNEVVVSVLERFFRGEGPAKETLRATGSTK